MNFGAEENFFVKHQDFFQNFNFSIEGISDDMKDVFIEVIKKLNGIISEDSDYILTEESYFKRKENKNRYDLYSIYYILDSIEAKIPLDIQKYRFLPNKLNHNMMSHAKNSCCLFAKYILRTNSCKRYYYDNICCELCKDNDDNEDEGTNDSTSDTVENINNEHNKNDNCAELDSSKIIQKNINIKMSNLSVNSDTEKEGKIDNCFKNLNNISVWKVKTNSVSMNTLNLNNQSAINVPQTNEQCETNIHNNIVLNDNLNVNNKSSNISNTDEETSESAILCQNKKQLEIMFEGPINKNNLLSNSESNSRSNNKYFHGSENQLMKSKDDEKIKRKINQNTELIEVISSGGDETNINYKKNKKSKYKRIINRISSSDSSAGISDSSSILNKDNRLSKKSQNRKLYAKKRTRHNVSLDNNTSSSSDDEVAKKRKYAMKSNQSKKDTNKSKSNKELISNKESSVDELTFSSCDEIMENSSYKWWTRLPPIRYVNPNFIEPRRTAGGRGATFTIDEQKLMIAYLVTTNKITLGTSRLPWRDMHNDGYMRHRSTEALNNNFRRVILPKIKRFGLPNNILSQFLTINRKNS